MAELKARYSPTEAEQREREAEQRERADSYARTFQLLDAITRDTAIEKRAAAIVKVSREETLRITPQMFAVCAVKAFLFTCRHGRSEPDECSSHRPCVACAAEQGAREGLRRR